MPSQKKQTKAKASAPSPASVKAPSKSKTKTKTKTKDSKTAAPSYIDLISNNGDFGDYFWNDASGTSQDNASVVANQGSENGHSAGPSGQ